ncbi:hypothetical protein N825_34795 [Skermanella stibiiresistens SB22]|uniref:MotA/TolQ/ExbB proton channel domain-containing protein n=1 Tax=Skermanella stibiiresistens SB22 TaxID=1385369 RepID=W9HA09_9PROT|nr:hypothetical protein [Skermanella stibiiresistens]EWY40648.1 hypothetical protein N825_34795 [Skermanella stibiiresistens SB22]
MDISIKRIFQLCAAFIVVATIYRAGNGGLETQSSSDTVLWDTLHALIAPLARVYLAMFNSPATAILLSGGLVMAGILLVVWFVYLKVRPVSRELDRLIQDCARAPVQTGRLDGLDRVLDSSLLGTDWRAWRAAGPGAGRPSAYLTLASLDRSGLRLGLVQSMPNYFVGLGLVMTFLGLIAGLWFASQGMRTADMVEARTALVHLLNSATFKFLTSVAGIGMSLVISLAFRISVQSLRDRLDLLCDRVEDAVARASFSLVAPALPNVSDGSAALAEQIPRLISSIDRLEQAIVRQSARIG